MSLKYKRWRDLMVANQLVKRGIRNENVLKAMGMVPRHLFVSEAFRDKAYSDHPLPIGDQQTISQPFIVAEMTQALDPNPDDRVLEIGTGSGYQAAVLSLLVFKVYTVERIYRLYSESRQIFDKLKYFNIASRYTDGTLGWKDEAPFDKIIVTAGSPSPPVKLFEQLETGGFLIAPVGSESSQNLMKYTKTKNGIKETNMGSCRFVKLIGQHGWGE
ncbi:MAG: protein-L-isoaspartate O-methyltransferase [Deltaproteobacteria bacterium]|nr:MAG: protein-L-isoaspartate O-methyltransferase [Deltaproteobacteria bacterium]